MGFTGAGYLIHSSYSAWQESPVATSIETHPIDGLDFPIVTVCPPKDSNTALNYDLMKADNTSLTENDRKDLKNKILEVMLKPSYDKYIQTMIATANNKSLNRMYGGYQSVPKPFGKNGLEIEVWNKDGCIWTPWFGEDYDESYHLEDRQHHTVLQFPEDLAGLVGSLLVELEVVTREGEGWQEEVQFSEGSLYKLYTEPKPWWDAEANCQREGGHLTSVTTEVEQQHLYKIAGNIKHA